MNSASVELSLPPNPVKYHPPWPVTIATYNIHGAVGADGRFAPERVGKVLREMRADIIALQEVPLGGRGIVNVLDMLRDATGFHAAAGPTCNGAQGCYGNAVLSRYAMRNIRSIDLSLGSREPRGALDADLDCHGQPLRIVATHLGLSIAERREQIRRLLQVFDTHQMPVILMGDINEWFVWGRALRSLVSHFQPVPAPATFPSRWPMLPLDRIWIRPRHRLVHVEVHQTPLARVASDHLPLIARIDG
ncbi:MAG TPA: endonuclease/exonuclease/phosphatase family protein [Burkholderiaceae bacterium]|jgi:endonuclease/exonuclease/phosphatase family metal-dependent hydrolase|nr:endonuclease/exonuclease/phosphatase family protein [Burkholderiaceae bacterium]